MLGWIGKRMTKGALRSAPKELLEGIGDVLKRPPEAIKSAWDGLSDEDKELLKKAAISAVRLTAKAVIAADKGGKTEF